MLVQGASNLQRGQDQSSWRVQHDVQRHGGVSQMNGPQDLFRIIHIDVPKSGESQDAHGFLTVHEENDAGLPLSFDPGDQALTGCLKKMLFENRLECGKHEEYPQDISRCHRQSLQSVCDGHSPPIYAGRRQYDPTPQRDLPQWPLVCNSKVECLRKTSISLWRSSIRSVISKITPTPAKFTPRSCLKRKIRWSRSTEEKENSGREPVLAAGSTRR